MSRLIWKVGDLLDLEYFLLKDRQHRESEGEDGLARRDRALYSRLGLPLEDRHPDRRSLIWRWLQERRNGIDPREKQELPGTLWKELRTLIACIGAAAGLVIGISLAAPLLAYFGKAPVNVTAYFALFVLLQLLVVAGQLAALGWRRLRRRPLPASLLGKLAGRLGVVTLKWLLSLLHRHRSSQMESSLTQLQERLQARTTYGVLFLWSVFFALQLLGIGLNCGIIGVTLAKVFFFDTAFGWQSTIQVETSVLAEIVRWIALPWSWLLPEHLAYPGVEAIEGSRIVLKDGIYRLTTENLVSWWPFMCCAVLFYGLLPRLGMLGLGLVLRRRLLRSLPSPEEPELRQLIRRMRTPTVETGGTVNREVRSTATQVQSSDEEAEEQAATEHVRGQEQMVHWVLVPEEVDAPSMEEQVQALFAPKKEEALRLRRFGDFDRMDSELLHELSEYSRANERMNITLVLEAWQPPIEEILSFMRDLCVALGDGRELVVGLVGAPLGTNWLTPATEEQQAIWSMKIAALNSTKVQVRSLVE